MTFVAAPADLERHVTRRAMGIFRPGPGRSLTIAGGVHELLLGAPRWEGSIRIGPRTSDDGVGAWLAALADRGRHTELPLELPVPDKLPVGLTATVAVDGPRSIATFSEAVALDPDAWIRIGPRLMQVAELAGPDSGQPWRYIAAGGVWSVVNAPTGLGAVALTGVQLDVTLRAPHIPMSAGNVQPLYLRVRPDPAADGAIKAAWTARLDPDAPYTRHRGAVPAGTPGLTDAGAAALWLDAALTSLHTLTDRSRVAVVPGGVAVRADTAVTAGARVRAVLHPGVDVASVRGLDWHDDVDVRWLEVPVL